MTMTRRETWDQLLRDRDTITGSHFLATTDVEFTEDDARKRGMELNEWYASVRSDPSKRKLAAAAACSSFWAFLCLVAWTIDEKAIKTKVRPFLPLEYVKLIAEFWMEKNTETGHYLHPVVAMFKSRQMLASWMLALRMIFECVTKRYAKVAVTSKTEKDGKKLLTRARLAYKYLPSWFKETMGLPIDEGAIFQTTIAIFPNGSEIHVLPEAGGDKIRSLAPSLVIGDEMAFQRYAEDSYTATKGTVDARCSYLMASTPNPGFFERLCTDTMSAIKGGGPAVYHVQATGLNIWTNKINEIDVISLHYSADPGKRSRQWRAQAQKGLAPYMWSKEFELDWHARGGQPIFPMFDPNVHITKRAMELVKHNNRWHVLVFGNSTGEVIYEAPVSLGLGIDHGHVNPAGALLAGCDREQDIFALWSFAEPGNFASTSARKIKQGIWNRFKLPHEEIGTQVIDAMNRMEGLRPGEVARRQFAKTEDFYKFEDQDRKRPILPNLRAVNKWDGSVQWGIDATGDMLHASLAIMDPENRYWSDHGWEPEAIEHFASMRGLWISKDAHHLSTEIMLARYKKYTDLTINQPETEIDANNHVRKPLAYLLQNGFEWAG